MKNIKKIGTVLGLFGLVYLASASYSPVAALYGSDVVLGVTTPHAPVNAGIADVLPQVVLAGFALTGMITTAILLKKTK